MFKKRQAAPPPKEGSLALVSSKPEHSFWPRALGAPLVLLTDFDFTISVVDVGDLICDTLAPYPADVLVRYARGECGSRELWMASFAHVDADAAAALADRVEIDPGFRDLVAWAEREGIPLAVVSDGFTLYIDRILGREGLGHLPVFANRYVAPGRLEWPYGNPACDLCGCCKAAVVRRLKQSGSHVVYFGDGSGDVYGASLADWVFAKSTLARFMEAQGSPYFRFTGFAGALAVLQANLDRFRDGTMQPRTTLRPHPRCRFAEPGQEACALG